MISQNRELLDEIGDYLLAEDLIANVMITADILYKESDENGNLHTSRRFALKGISKSLLFGTINQKLREQFGERMPLLYSEPIIMIDPDQTKQIIKGLTKI